MKRRQFPVERRANEVIPHARGGFSQDLQAIRVTLEELYHVALENTDRIESMLRASARNLWAIKRDPLTPPGFAQDDKTVEHVPSDLSSHPAPLIEFRENSSKESWTSQTLHGPHRHSSTEKGTAGRLGSWNISDPGKPHGLMTYFEAHPLGTVFAVPCDVLLSESDVVQPDLLVVLENGQAHIMEKNIQGPPDVIIEILSPSTAARDRELKRKRYEYFGVREYWLVDPENNSLEILKMNNARFVLHSLSTAPSSCSSSIIPHLTLDLAWLFH